MAEMQALSTVALRFAFVLIACSVAKGADIIGLVQDPSIAGLSRVAVELRGTERRVALTGATGAFRIESVGPGIHSLWIRLGGFQPKVLRVTVSEGAQEIDLGPITLLLTVYDEWSEPEELDGPFAAVRVDFLDAPRARWTVECTTSQICGRLRYSGTGGVRLSKLRPGRYKIRVESKGLLPEVREFELVEGIGFSFKIPLYKCLERTCTERPLLL